MDISTIVFGCLYFLAFAYTAFQIYLKDWAQAIYGTWTLILFIMLGTWYLPWGKTFFFFPSLFILSFFSFHSLAKKKDIFAFILTVISFIFFLGCVFFLSRLHI